MTQKKEKRKFPKGLKSKSLIYTAFLSVRKEVKLAFYIAITSLFLIEIWLIKIPAPFELLSSLGSIYLKACYAIFGATIFYFINVQIPKEQKKLKSFIFVYNRVANLNRNLDFITDRLNLRKADGLKLTEQQFNDAVILVNPNTQIQTFYDRDFANWIELLKHLHNETQNTLKDLLLIQDVVDSSILEPLFYIENTFNLIHFSRMKNNISQERWKMFGLDFYNIWYNNEKLSKASRKSYFHTLRQQRENHYRERIFPNLK
jgi:hypothetical protein